MSTLREHIGQLKQLKQTVGEYGPAFVTISQVTMATHLHEIEAALDRIADLERQSVTKILVAVVPGDDGVGEERYAKSVDEVVDLLTTMAERNEDLERQLAELRQPTAQQVESARDAELRQLRKISWLIGSIFVHGDFKAETFNERELEKLLRAQGTFWDSLEEFDAALQAGKEKEHGSPI